MLEFKDFIAGGGIQNIEGLSNIEEKEKKPVSEEDKLDNIINKTLDVDKIQRNLKEKDINKTVIYAFGRLVLKLKDRLSDYDTVLGDDTSGRVPALFFRNIINLLNKSKGKENVQTNFVEAGNHGVEEKFNAIDEFVKDKKKDINKLLLVTEIISSGSGIKDLVKILESNKIDFDIAAVSIAPSYDPNKLSQHLVYGDQYFGIQAGMNFYRKPFTGVNKGGYPAKAHSEYAKSGYKDIERMKQVRKDMRYLANELVILAE